MRSRPVDVAGEVARRNKAGEEPETLAAEFGVTVRTVRRWLTTAGLTEPRRPPADPAAVVAAYASGEPLKALASRFGIDDKTVLAMVRGAGQPARMPRVTEEIRSLIVARHQEGAKVTKIAAELGVHRATVYRALREG